MENSNCVDNANLHPSAIRSSKCGRIVLSGATIGFDYLPVSPPNHANNPPVSSSVLVHLKVHIIPTSDFLTASFLMAVSEGAWTFDPTPYVYRSYETVTSVILPVDLINDQLNAGGRLSQVTNLFSLVAGMIGHTNTREFDMWLKFTMVPGSDSVIFPFTSQGTGELYYTMDTFQYIE